MSKQTLLNFAPDADLTIIKDYSKQGKVMVLQIETKVEIHDPEDAKTLEDLLNLMNGDFTPERGKAVLDHVMKFAGTQLQKPGPALAMLTAACTKVERRK